MAGSNPLIKTLLTPDGEPHVQWTVEDATFLFTPDAGVEFALNLLSACYAARTEHALYVYAKQHNLPATELITQIRHDS